MEAAKQKKAASKAVKDAAGAAKAEQATAADWSRGANNRGAERKESAAAKADEAARKRSEKAALLAEEEAGAGPSKVSKGVGAGMKAKKSKGKKKSDLDLLEDSELPAFCVKLSPPWLSRAARGWRNALKAVHAIGAGPQAGSLDLPGGYACARITITRRSGSRRIIIKGLFIASADNIVSASP